MVHLPGQALRREAESLSARQLKAGVRSDDDLWYMNVYLSRLEEELNQNEDRVLNWQNERCEHYLQEVRTSIPNVRRRTVNAENRPLPSEAR